MTGLRFGHSGWAGRLYGHLGEPLDAHRAGSRISAYVYGDVLVLAASVGVSYAAVRSGEAVLVIAATVASTYLAHVLADVIGALFTGSRLRETVVAELRDALPVVSAGIPPAAFLGTAALGWLPADVAQDAASALLLARVAAVGLVYRRFHRSVPLLKALSFGATAALVAAMAVALKLVFAH